MPKRIREGTRVFGEAWIAPAAVITLMVLSPNAWGGVGLPWFDPFESDAAVAPAPGVRWESRDPLPVVPEPAVPESLKNGAPLTLPELTEFALRNNPATRQAWLVARAAAAGVGIEEAARLPEVSGLFGLTRSEQVSASGTSVPWQTRYGPSVSLSYLLFDFGARAGRVEAAEYDLLAANLSHNRVLQDVVFQVEQAYYLLLGFDALEEANALSLQNNQTALEAAQKRRESGLATVADIYRVETQVAQAQLNLTRSRGGLEKAKGQLASAVGLPVTAVLNVQMQLSPPSVRTITASMTELLERAKASRPDLVAAETQFRAARSSADAAAYSSLPSIEVTAETGTAYFTDQRPSVNSYNVSVNLRVPLFSGFRDTYTVRQAQAQAQQAEAARDLLTRQTELEVWQAYYDVQTAASGMTSTEAQVRSAEQTAQAALARYQAGYGSVLDLITAQQDAANARVQRIQSFLDWFIALARLNHSLGMSGGLIEAGGAP